MYCHLGKEWSSEGGGEVGGSASEDFEIMRL
jgi:hypothetical protein